MSKNAEAETLKKYLAGKKLLIVDPSSSARSGIFKVLSDLGCKANQITLANNYQNAWDEISTNKPHIVITEYDLGKSCGLELLQKQRTENPESKQSLFLLVTGNTSQTAVARSAEEDIDGYILKPFTPEVLRKTLITTAIAKIKPSAYYVAIDMGKELLKENKIDEAEEKMKEATTLDEKPSLALYYLGQIKFLKKILNQSEGAYKKGLEFNKIHYKCMVGLFELLMDLKAHDQAYEVVKRISQYFPANPKRLSEVLRLAIINGKYEDVEKYYNMFINIEERSDVLIKYICAALVVCGKYYLQTQNRTRALELFRKAGATSAGRVNILKEIIYALVDFGNGKEALEFLNRFPPDMQSTKDYKVLEFEIANLSNGASAVIAKGLELLNQDVHSPRMITALIGRYQEAGKSQAAEDLIDRAAQLYPQQQEMFKKLSEKKAA